MKKILLQIPEPCHEEWNKMTPNERGRYCDSCCKTVVDFTGMTDQQIIHYFSIASGKTCGHFANDQLNRVIQPPATPAKKNIWAMILSFMLPVVVYNKATAQGKVKVDTVKCVNKDAQLTIRGKVLPRPSSQRMITGKVVDASGVQLHGASVSLKGSKKGTTTDSTGAFKIFVDTGNVELIVSFIGYTKVSTEVSSTDSHINIIMKEQYIEATVGFVVTTVKKKKSISKKIIDTAIQTLNPSKINVYPNPVVRGAAITVDLKNIAAYDCYLINNQGNIISTPLFQRISKTKAQLPIPSSLVPGIYYVTVFDKKSKKKHTEKIIVE